jgi:hypothetical protein
MKIENSNADLQHFEAIVHGLGWVPLGDAFTLPTTEESVAEIRALIRSLHRNENDQVGQVAALLLMDLFDRVMDKYDPINRGQVIGEAEKFLRESDEGGGLGPPAT